METFYDLLARISQPSKAFLTIKFLHSFIHKSHPFDVTRTKYVLDCQEISLFSFRLYT